MLFPEGIFRTVILYGAMVLIGSFDTVGQSLVNYQTFGFRKFEATVISPYEMIHVSQENAQFVRSHVRNELEMRGLIQSSTPDMFVDLFINLKLERQATGGTIALPGGSSANTRGFSIYEVGTLTIKLMDAQNNQLLWEGSRTIPLWKKKEKKLRRQVDDVVAKVLKNFDPATLGTTP